MSSLDVRAIDEADLRKTARPKAKQELAVYLSEEAFDRAVERGGSDVTREIGGVLVGELLKDETGPYLKVETTIDALHAEEKGAELTFTHATWDHINKEMDTKHAGKKVVGWYHTHPGFGIFLSDRDQFIHKGFFNLPFQIALVYDPKSKEHGIFTWRDNEVWRMRRYFIGAREHAWDGNRTTARPVEKDKDDDDDDKKKSSRKDDSGDEPLFGSGSMAPMVLIGIVVMLLAGFVGHWLGTRSAEPIIRQLQIETIKASQAGGEQRLAQLEHDLITLMRVAVGDEPTQRVAAQAINNLNAAIAGLEKAAGIENKPPAPAPAPAAGSGSAAPAPVPTPAPPPAVADPKLTAAIAQLKQARDGFVRLSQEHDVADQYLAELERRTARGGALREDLVQEVSQHRAAVGTLYAELATDVAKTDPIRAQRLLATAAVVDPGNRAHYEAQLQSFAKGATLPRTSGTPEGGKP